MTDDHADDLDDDRDLNRDETHQDSGAVQPDHSRTYRYFRYLSENFMTVAASVGLGLFIVSSIIGYELPRNLKIIGLSTLIVIPLVGRPTAKKTKELLWDPNLIWIVEIDAASQSKGGIYNVPSQRFREWSIEDGSLDWINPNLAFASNVNLEEQTLEGTWRGTLTDRELMRALHAVEECRGQLEKDAKRGFAIEAQAFSIIRNATRKAVLRIVSTFERGTLPDEGEGLTDEIDAAIEKFGIDRKIRADESDEAPDSDVPGGDLVDGLDDAATAEPEGATADD